MKSVFLATVSTLTLASVAAAADLPTKAPVRPAEVVAWNWTGFYVGINGGAVWHRASFEGFDAVGTVSTASADSTSGTFGGQVGFNWQSGRFVVGVEADLNWVDASGSGPTTVCLSCTYNSKLNWLGTVRGRAGVLAGPATLIYGTGGYALGRVENFTNVLGGFSESSTKDGWTAGGGIEHMFARNWTVKAEALYVDLGDSSAPGVLGNGYGSTFTNTAVVARVGANFKF